WGARGLGRDVCPGTDPERPSWSHARPRRDRRPPTSLAIRRHEPAGRSVGRFPAAAAAARLRAAGSRAVPLDGEATAGFQGGARDEDSARVGGPTWTRDADTRAHGLRLNARLADVCRELGLPWRPPLGTRTTDNSRQEGARREERDSGLRD